MIDDTGLMNNAVADFLVRMEANGIDSPRLDDSMPGIGNEKVKIWPAWVSTWIKVFSAFIAGIVIGRLGGNRHNPEYTQL